MHNLNHHKIKLSLFNIKIYFINFKRNFFEEKVFSKLKKQ